MLTDRTMALDGLAGHIINWCPRVPASTGDMSFPFPEDTAWPRRPVTGKPVTVMRGERTSSTTYNQRRMPFFVYFVDYRFSIGLKALSSVTIIDYIAPGLFFSKWSTYDPDSEKAKVTYERARLKGW